MSAFGHLLTDTVTVSFYAGEDRYGNPTWSPPQTVACRLEEKAERVVDSTGAEVVSRAQFVTETPITVPVRIWLPGKDPNDPTQALQPKAVGSARTLDGRASLWTVWL